MKKGIWIILLLLVVVVGCGKKEEEVNYAKGKHHVLISIKDYGDITLELDADIAPITVENFINLANKKFYNGLKFHRIINDFMIQGGASSEPSDKIKGEFKENGVENTISHVRGVISMARTDVYDSASSQFFIVHKDSTFLDGLYAAFGHVTKGMEVVDKIATDAKPIDNNGTIKEEEQPIITEIKVLD